MNDFWICVREGIGGVFWSVFVRGKCTPGWGRGMECRDGIDRRDIERL